MNEPTNYFLEGRKYSIDYCIDMMSELATEHLRSFNTQVFAKKAKRLLEKELNHINTMIKAEEKKEKTGIDQ